MSELGKEYTDADKMEEFTSNFQPHQDMIGSTCYKAVHDKGKEFMNRMEKKEQYDRDGRPLTFAEFTSFVIDEERLWIKQVDSKRGVSQTTTSNSTNNSSSNTSSSSNSQSNYVTKNSWNKETGEPLHCWVNAIDVSVLYRDVDRLAEEQFKRLPNITKEYFRNNSGKEMPKKFANMQKPKPCNRPQKKKS